MTAVAAQHSCYDTDLLADLRLVAAELKAAFVGLPIRVGQPLEYPLARGGKLLRPVVLLAASRLAADPAPERIDLAVAAELLHLASLIHDDVIDCARRRRGRPSLNARWGEGVAVLTGDVYVTAAMTRLARLCGGRFLPMFIDCAAGMCLAELKQTLARFDPEQTEGSYLAAISGKTAALFSACAGAGGILAGLGAAEQESLTQYGWNLGMAFQLADDIADLSAHPGAETGGQDIAVGIWTLPVLHCLRTPAGPAVLRLLASGRARAELPAIRAALRQSGSLAYAIERARSFCRQARAALGALPTGAAAATLADVVNRVDADLKEYESAACE